MLVPSQPIQGRARLQALPADHTNYAAAARFVYYARVRRELAFTQAQERVFERERLMLRRIQALENLRMHRAKRLKVTIRARERPSTADFRTLERAVLQTLSVSQKSRLSQLGYQALGPLCFRQMPSLAPKPGDEASKRGLDRLALDVQALQATISLEAQAKIDAAAHAFHAVFRRLARPVEGVLTESQLKRNRQLLKEAEALRSAQIERVRIETRAAIWAQCDALLRRRLSASQFARYIQIRGPLYPFPASPPEGLPWP
jgi:hypothetical protein